MCVNECLLCFWVVPPPLVTEWVSAQNCHLRELDLCSATLLLFNQNPSGVATTDNELDKQCGFLSEAQGCFNNFTTRCVNK